MQANPSTAAAVKAVLDRVAQGYATRNLDLLLSSDLGVGATERIIENFRTTRFGREVTDREVRDQRHLLQLQRGEPVMYMNREDARRRGSMVPGQDRARDDAVLAGCEPAALPVRPAPMLNRPIRPLRKRIGQTGPSRLGKRPRKQAW